jgi:hypothetical protein
LGSAIRGTTPWLHAAKAVGALRIADGEPIDPSP